MARVGRPREFDIDEAVEAAMGAFWAGGYEGTSLADLIAAMGLQKGSIYKAFGDKHSLFLAALDRYIDANLAAMKEAVAAASTPMEGIESAVLGMVGALTAPQNQRRGCLAVNSAAELAGRDPVVATRMQRLFEHQQRVLEPVIEAAQAVGAVRGDLSAQTLAEILVAVVPGSVLSVKSGAPMHVGQGVVESVLVLMRADSSKGV